METTTIYDNDDNNDEGRDGNDQMPVTSRRQQEQCPPRSLDDASNNNNSKEQRMASLPSPPQPPILLETTTSTTTSTTGESSFSFSLKATEEDGEQQQQQQPAFFLTQEPPPTPTQEEVGAESEAEGQEEEKKDYNTTTKDQQGKVTVAKPEPMDVDFDDDQQEQQEQKGGNGSMGTTTTTTITTGEKSILSMVAGNSANLGKNDDIEDDKDISPPNNNNKIGFVIPPSPPPASPTKDEGRIIVLQQQEQQSSKTSSCTGGIIRSQKKQQQQQPPDASHSQPLQPKDDYRLSNRNLRNFIPSFNSMKGIMDDLGGTSEEEERQQQDDDYDDNGRVFDGSDDDYDDVDDDDEEEEDDDESEEDESEEEEKEERNIQEKRRHNIQRNKERLEFLGLAHNQDEVDDNNNNDGKTLSPQKTTKHQSPATHNLQRRHHGHYAPLRGMLFATPHNSNQYNQAVARNPSAAAAEEEEEEEEEEESEEKDHDDDNDDEFVLLEQIQKSYPHRECQIQQLWSLLSPALPSPPTTTTTTSTGPPRVAHSDSTSTNHNIDTMNVPAPIFVTGVAATGKTSIVRDLTTRLKQQMNFKQERWRTSTTTSNNTMQDDDAPRVGTAYVNCSTIETFDQLLHEAFRQLAHDMKVGRGRHKLGVSSTGNRRPKRSRKKRKRGKDVASCYFSSSSSSPIKKVKCEQSTQRKQEVQGIASTTTTSSLSMMMQVPPQSNTTTTTATAEPLTIDNDKETKTTISNKDAIVAKEPKGATKCLDETTTDPTPTPMLQITSPNRANGRTEVLFEPRRRSQRVYKLMMTTTTMTEADLVPADDKKGKLAREFCEDLKLTTNPAIRYTPGEDIASSAAAAGASRSSVHVAAASFGQELKESLFKHKDDAGFLILDNAEGLLSLSSSSSSSSSAKTNFLAQLLLIPRDKALNLTIIVITKNILLEHTRFNNLVTVDKSLATLSSAIQPMRVHFPAYKGKERFRKILAQKLLLKRIIGPSMLRSYDATKGKDHREQFPQRVVHSFLNVLVQSLYGSCRDLKEMVRLGRSLWPLYVLPLHSSRIEKTMQSVQKMFSTSKPTSSTESCWKHVLSFLDQQILPQMRQKLDRSMYTMREEVHRLGATSTSSNENGSSETNLDILPYLTKCLLLAAFLCQTNRADKDKQLFTIQKNGKRSNANKRKSPNEDLAFGAGTKDGGASKLYRPRMFPMERMLSVFVSIVGLNQDQSILKGAELDPGSIGSSDLFESLAHLRDMGVLHDKANLRANQSRDALNLAAPRFWCSLTRSEADTLAKSVNFQLESYLF